MKTLFVFLLVCSGSAPVCNKDTARAVQAFRAPEGVIICGLPIALTIQEGAVKPAEDEYIKTRCELK